MNRDIYHLTIYWITTMNTGDEKILEQGHFPVRVCAYKGVDARNQVLNIADRMSEVFQGTDTNFFYRVDL